MTRLTIKVTKDIIEKSRFCGQVKDLHNSSTHCAIALAIRDIFPDARVSPNHIYPFGPIFLNNDDMKRVYIQLPKEAIIFISIFDNMDACQRLELAEITFDIEIPDIVIEKIDIDELKPLLANHPTLALSV